MAEWTNWTGTSTASGIDVVRVRDVDHLRQVCAGASARGGRLKPIGAAHSFTGIGQPVQTQLDVSRLSGLISVDAERSRAWLGAGTRLGDAVRALHDAGLGLSNQGDYDRQTLAGATSTGTHGTGLGLTGFAGMVRGVEVVLADGNLLRVTETENAELLPAMSLSLGALGVLTAIEYQCEPRYLLSAHEGPARFGAVLEELDERVASADHFEFFWFPDTDRVLAKTNRRHRDEALRAPLPAWKDRLDNDILSNRVFGVVTALTRRFPRLTAPINQVSARALSEKSYTDWSHVVYPTERNVRFCESEFSVPRADVVAVLRRLEAWHRAHRSATPFPVEVRFTGADDRWLSTSYDRESAYIAVHQVAGRPYEEYFRAFWEILRDYEARPHWGKLHELAAADLRRVYPRFDDFVAVRDRLDPARVFANPYLDRVLGP
ncbi:D-arabinono-1,4-lactone oxidase [Cumulibacter manganitolerans]|uniref:D-arabinono-1,4-lactone oxidase n=1 Tax=Cumulibacter manganitolerans TaxID=1884992 RepID=UPI001298033D|nr:D-arabinono-1,4-lactone oxidase [Cumulibacter manganitolerans]